MNELSIYARLILQAIGTGFLLRVAHDTAAASLVDRYSDSVVKPEYWCPREPIGPLDPGPVEELLASNLLHKLAMEQQSQRLGWSQLGVDGTKAALYCMIQ